MQLRGLLDDKRARWWRRASERTAPTPSASASRNTLRGCKHTERPATMPGIVSIPTSRHTLAIPNAIGRPPLPATSSFIPQYRTLDGAGRTAALGHKADSMHCSKMGSIRSPRRRASSVGGTSRLRALVVLRLMSLTFHEEHSRSGDRERATSRRPSRRLRSISRD